MARPRSGDVWPDPGVRNRVHDEMVRTEIGTRRSSAERTRESVSRARTRRRTRTRGRTEAETELDSTVCTAYCGLPWTPP